MNWALHMYFILAEKSCSAVKMMIIKLGALACILMFVVPPGLPVSGQTDAATGGRSGWELASELEATVRIPPGKHYTAWFDNATGGFGRYDPYPTLTASARQALNLTPAWLRDDLERTFLELGVDMDRYAAVISGAADPRFADEIAFTVAHTSPDILKMPSTYPGLFAENAASIYAADTNLSYVRLVEKGDHTTAAYINAAGAEIELPRDIYYWFIVHPKITDERPTYIDPSNGQSAAPPGGKFWRDYLMNHNDSGYPLLRDMLANTTRLWNGTVNSDVNNGAVGVIIRWVKSVMAFTSDNERPVQPVRIYAKHIGRCGEHEDITCAAARAALIPCIGAEDLAEDHVWNEFFYDGRWVSWEPVNTMVDSPYTYAAWGKKFPAVNGWRGDDYVWQQTGIYTETCTLRVTVKDRDGRPVEGADIWVGNEYSGDTRFRMIATWNATNATGMAEFRCGKGNNLYARVDTDALGGAPTYSATSTGANPFILLGSDTSQVVANSQPVTYNYTFTLTKSAVSKKSSFTETAPPAGNYKLELTVKAVDSEVKGANLLTGPHYYTHDSPVSLYSFLAPDDEYTKFNYSQPFKGTGFSDKADITSELIVPDNGKWHVVVGNDAAAAIQRVQLTVRFYVKPFITVCNPKTGALFSEGTVVTVEGTADAGDVTKVELSFDNGNLWKDAAYNSTARTWKYLWNTSGLASGNYSVTARLVHGGGPTLAEPLLVRLDAEDPSLTVRLDDILKGGGPVRLEGSAYDNFGVAKVEVEIEGPGEGGGWKDAGYSCATASWGFDWQTDYRISGEYNVTVRAMDDSRRTCSISREITLDAEAPTVTIDTKGLFRGGPVIELGGNANDMVQLKGVSIVQGGRTDNATIKGGSWYFSWNTNGLPSGKYSIMAIAEDAAGWTASASTVINLDADMPILVFDAPESPEAGSIVNLHGTVSDKSGLDGIEITTDGSNWTAIESYQNEEWSFDWDTSMLMPGNHTVTVQANDTVGNLAWASRNIMLLDTIPPQVALEMPREIPAGELLALKVKLVERTGTCTVEYSTDGKVWSGIPYGPKGYSADIDTLKLALGKNKLRVRATDASGNTGTAEKEVTVDDEQSPAVSITGATVVKNGMTAGGRASDNYRLRTLEYTVDGSRWNPLEVANGSWNLTLASLKPGKYTLRLRATDAAGKVSEASAEFVIKAPPVAGKGFIPGYGLVAVLTAFLACMWFAIRRRPRG